ncbi:DUF1801 domain-containing protein [Flavobacterium sp.]|uniref:YdeI/OmpD-associated family protein n=1 Tax=Flavobacterium sp. TaxID=239 RepID=UPI00262545E3|nr:DUF1801 domain-containing protein [Flavobacterium sp.]
MDEKHKWDKVNQWEEELDYLKTILLQTELVETTKWGGPTYTYNGKNVLGIGGFKSYVGIWFFNGIFLKDPHKVLVNAQEGVTKALRQWRFQSKADMDEKLILQYVQEAIANEKAGIHFKPEKKEALQSEYLQQQLAQDSNLQNAFSQFTPYKQKEFIEYIATAKQEKTKLSRFEKIKPLILAGIGLNDKYR